jgi:ubiquinone/menaquinone biosynthesis C-methylase UbiE
MGETNPYVQSLLVANPLREPVLRAVIRALQLPAGSCGLDVGCGIGLQELLLAQAVGPGGHVTGSDISPDLLARGECLARQAGLAERISFRQGDMSHLPCADGSFDWLWSADCAGYPLGELAPLLREFARVVRPGGSVILLAWSSQQVLPGYPLLEAQLNATCSSYAPYLAGKNPELHFMRAPRWMQEAGLQDVEARTFVGDIRSPLSSAERAALVALFEMLWREPVAGAASEEWAERQRLCVPGSPDFVLDRPGYYAFITYTMFRGRVTALP